MVDDATGVRARSIDAVLASLVLLLLAFIPFLEVLVRKIFRTGIPGSSDYVFHLVLWIAFLGGIITSREKRHLALTAGIDLLKEPYSNWIRVFNAFISASFTFAFAVSALSFVIIGFDPTVKVGFLPIQAVVLIMPVGFSVMSVLFIRGMPKGKLRFIAAFGIPFGVLLSLSPIINILYTFIFNLPPFFDTVNDVFYQILGITSIPLVIILIVSALTGTPIFVVLGGIGYILFARSWAPLEIIPNEGYTMLTSNTLPALPMFALAGFLLSESKAGERLVRLFRAFLGWLPGGMAVMAVVVCAFFTTFTGASGVTILALGALLSFVLIQSGGYTKRFSNGLLTASGSIGLLFPPSLPIILYAVIAQISVKEMFIGGILPGIVMVIALSVVGVVVAVRNKVPRVPFDLREAALAFREAIWEILLPIIILFMYFGGFATIVETGAIAVVYTLIIQVVVHRDIKFKRIPGVVLKSVPIIGGILIILAVAKGLSYFLVDAEIPMRLTAWVEANVHSKYVFLIFLNLALLVTGCLMDIFSAIMVVVPLIIPLANLFGIHPVHLGVIFLANLELGYLTPPVGLNLFLASYRFEEPLGKTYRNVLPFFLILLVMVLVITYVPFISTAFLK